MVDNITADDIELVRNYLVSENGVPRLTNGPMCREFEDAWSRWLGVKYSVFVSSGSAANYITMQVLAFLYPERKEVIVPPLTWVSDISAVLAHGLKPKFVDIDMATLSLNSEKVMEALTDDTLAVFVTHAQGFCGLNSELLRTLQHRGIYLIEDVCESHGATYAGKRLGTYGLMSNFSFFYAHHMSTIEGGMVCTDREDVYNYLRAARSHGMVREFDDQMLCQQYAERFADLNPSFIFFDKSFNFRNNEIGGVLGVNQLKKLDQNNTTRSKNFQLFLELINPNIFVTDFRLEGSSNYAFPLILQPDFADKVDQLMALMDESAIEYRRGNAGGGNQLRQPYLKHLGLDPRSMPVCDYIHFYGFYVGNYPQFSKRSIRRLCEILNSLC
tara:strand:- start:2684 stop:3841 length:1158 start_codon:yes stop_codon:yes gene_type:complete